MGPEGGSAPCTSSVFPFVGKLRGICRFCGTPIRGVPGPRPGSAGPGVAAPPAGKTTGNEASLSIRGRPVPTRRFCLHSSDVAHLNKSWSRSEGSRACSLSARGVPASPLAPFPFRIRRFPASFLRDQIASDPRVTAKLRGGRRASKSVFPRVALAV